MVGQLGERLFLTTVRQKERRGLPFILAIYQALDEFKEMEMASSGIELACKQGCALCCYQLISCTEIEIDEILFFLKRMRGEVGRELRAKLKESVGKWKQYYQRNRFTLERNCFKVIQDWKGRPCPFLNQATQSCDIYPVRIIDCRTFNGLTPCSSDLETTKRFLFESEKLANNLILEEQARKTSLSDRRLVAISPVLHWLSIKRF